MPRKDGGLILACLWAAGALAAVSATDSVAIRALACLPLALYWPGYAFLRAIGQPSASSVEWHALAVMWSLASLVLGGFLLNALGLFGPLGWAAWLGGVVVLASAVGAIRGKATRGPVVPGRRRPVAIGVGPCVVLLAAFAVAGAAFGVAIHDARTFREFQYTAFWMVPDSPAHPGAVTIGARNAEGRPMRYDIEVTSKGQVIAAWRSLQLEPDESVTREMAIGAPTSGSAMLEGRLFESGKGDRVYRKVWLRFGEE